MTKPFVHIHSEYGWIGSIHWLNSNRGLHWNYFFMRLVRTWGGFSFNEPVPGEMIRSSDIEAL